MMLTLKNQMTTYRTDARWSGWAPAALLAGLSMAAAFGQTTVTGGLESPIRISITPAGHLLVSEAGGGSNAGRISLVRRNGARMALISGLPSAASPEGAGSGPTATEIRGTTLYVLIGQANTVVTGSMPGTEVPDPRGPASPILSSLLAIRFSADPETFGQGFTLSPNDHFRLGDGYDVTLDNGAGGTATVQLVTDFRDLTPDPRTIVRASNPFGLALDPSQSNVAYVVDAGLNSLVRVDLETGRRRTITRFPPVPNPAPGPPVMDPVPTTVRAYGDRLLVTLLTGFPFTPGAAGVLSVDPATGQTERFIATLSSAIDIAWRDRPDGPQFFTLEFSSNFLASGPGRLKQYETPLGVELADRLVTPTGIALDPETGDLFVTELATGRVVQFTAQ